MPSPTAPIASATVFGCAATSPSTPTATLALGPLAQYVLDHQIHLEMAPTCHVQVGAVDSSTEHPIGAFLRHGFNVGINTDNRLMSDVMPSSELLAVATTFDLTWPEIERLVTNAIDSVLRPARPRRIAATDPPVRRLEQITPSSSPRRHH